MLMEIPKESSLVCSTAERMAMKKVQMMATN